MLRPKRSNQKCQIGLFVAFIVYISIIIQHLRILNADWLIAVFT